MKQVLCIAAISVAATAGSAVADVGADIGVLTCKLTGVKNEIVYTKEKFDCEFKPTSGESQNYNGQIKAIGVNLSVTKDMTLVWAVLSPTGSPKSATALKGNYVGGSATVSLAAGGGANVLVGGLEHSFTLQPLSVAGVKGTGVSVGIEKFELK